MKLDLYLFVQEGCRPCIYAKNNLQRTEGWENYVKIVDVKDENARPLMIKYQIDATPTLLAVKNDSDGKTFCNPKEMTKQFWTDLFESLE